MPVNTYSHPLFGLVEFEVDAWTYGAPIRRFLSGFDLSDVTDLQVPQLIGIPGTNGGVMKFHKRAHDQVLQVFRDLEQLDLMSYVHMSAGSFYPRLKKPASGNVSREPSNHSFGIAIDINSEELPLGTNDTGLIAGTVRPLAPTFQALGFRWGQSFSDPMHFEVKTFVDHPRPTVRQARLERNGTLLDVQLHLLRGHAYASTGDFAATFGGSSVFRAGDPDTVVQTPPNRGPVTIDCWLIGNRAFAKLTLLAAAYGLRTTWDNDTKTATLS
jgi:hypothetical protein